MAGGSWPPVTPAPRDPVPFSGLFRYQTHMQYIDIHAGKTNNSFKKDPYWNIGNHDHYLGVQG